MSVGLLGVRVDSGGVRSHIPVCPGFACPFSALVCWACPRMSPCNGVLGAARRGDFPIIFEREQHPTASIYFRSMRAVATQRSLLRPNRDVFDTV